MADQSKSALKLYIDGGWISPQTAETAPIINPATEQEIGRVCLANSADLDLAVTAAKRAFPSYSRWTIAERLELLGEIDALLKKRNDEIGDAVQATMGAPQNLARGAQAGSGSQHFSEIIRVLKNYSFETRMGSTMVRREPIGVCALIAPWNWPVNQIATKVAPALAAGCTMILKPSLVTPLDAVILAEIMDEAGVPSGVFNLILGRGRDIGSKMCSHKDIDMVSFTGSTAAGISVSQAAAPTIKRVALELGGKSANIILPSADVSVAVPQSVRDVMLNSGQSCNASTRLLVPESRYDEVAELAVKTCESLAVGMDGDIGPVANASQFKTVQDYIQSGLDEGALLLTGGSDRPKEISQGYFIPPTVFGGVSVGMRIEREEIFGPVLTITTYKTVKEAVDIANASDYGLSGAVWAGTRGEAYEVAAQIRTGMVHINGAPLDSAAPFGGYKASGIGREWGVFGLEEFLELKSVYGAQ